jgi:predicted amidohydrolase
LQDVTIASIQMTSVVDDIEVNFASIDRLLGDAVQKSADIACFPEVSVALADKGVELIFMPDAADGAKPAPYKQAGWERYVPARKYDSTVFTAICNQLGDNEAGHIFEGVTLVLYPVDKAIERSNTGTIEDVVIAQLETMRFEEARHVTKTFLRHIRPHEIYEAWDGK